MPAVDNESLPDASTSRFTWKIESISKHSGRKTHSDIFVVGGYSWSVNTALIATLYIHYFCGLLLFLLPLCRRVLVFPTGNNVNHLSMYLDVADAKSLPTGWSRSAQFSLAVINQLDSKHSVRKGTSCCFSTDLIVYLHILKY